MNTMLLSWPVGSIGVFSCRCRLGREEVDPIISDVQATATPCQRFRSAISGNRRPGRFAEGVHDSTAELLLQLRIEVHDVRSSGDEELVDLSVEVAR
jgi:hypothetical protein